MLRIAEPARRSSQPAAHVCAGVTRSHLLRFSPPLSRRNDFDRIAFVKPHLGALGRWHKLAIERGRDPRVAEAKLLAQRS